MTDLNLIFVRDEYFGLFGIEDNSLRSLRPNEDFVTHLICGYDGRILLEGAKRMPWHRMEIKPPMMQQMPESIQGFPDNYSFTERLRYKVYRMLRKISGFQ